jgi:hypothetical protein
MVYCPTANTTTITTKSVMYDGPMPPIEVAILTIEISTMSAMMIIYIKMKILVLPNQ